MARTMALTIGVVLAALMAGCAQIPTSGPVIGGKPVEPADQQPPFIQVQAPPPESGADPVGVVDGYIEAMSSYAPGFETARMFLTEDAALSWDASAGVTVYRGARPDVEATGPHTVRVTMSVAGRVGVDGTYATAEPGTTEELELTLEQHDGEWRIADPPNGIFIAEFSFSREYEAHNVYFFDSEMEVLVPDPVYLPQSENAATLLAQRVLAGPSEWLAPAVQTSFPEDAELGVNAVPVDSGTAEVELGAEAGQLSPEERELMTAQLVWTLDGLPEVDDVAVTSDGIPLPQGEEALTQTDNSMASYAPPQLSLDSPLYFVGEDGLMATTGEEPEPARGELGEKSDIREFAVNIGQNRAVVINDAGTRLQAASFGDDEVVETLRTGVDLTSPAWDRQGLIWTVDHGVQGHGVAVNRADGEQVELVAPELVGSDVDRLSLSLDGTRIAMIVDGRAMVGTVVRDVEGRSIRVERLRPLGPVGQAVDVGWNASDSVAVLLATEGREPLPYVVEMSGEVTPPRGLATENAVGIAATPPSERGIVLETADGVLLEQRTGNRWSQIGDGHDPAYPG